MSSQQPITQNLEERRTARMVLTRMRESDFADLFRMHSDPRVMATLGGVLLSEEETRVRLNRHVVHWDQHGFGRWTMRDPATGQFIGRGGISHFPLDDKMVIELGYALMPQYWGRGLATELAQESIRVGFEVLGLSSLVCFTEPTNRGSRCVMEKVGFVYERDGVYANLPHVFYRLDAPR